jgi:hypothetical protein
MIAGPYIQAYHFGWQSAQSLKKIIKMKFLQFTMQLTIFKRKCINSTMLRRTRQKHALSPEIKYHICVNFLNKTSA